MPAELLLDAPRSVRLAPYSEEPLRDDEVRATAIVSGISHGTELTLWRGGSPFHGHEFDRDLRAFVETAWGGSYPARLGYEWVGRVRAVGDAVRHVAPGDLVHLPRSHAETQTVSMDEARGLPFVLPGNLAPERATLLQTTTIALQAVQDAGVTVGDRIAVFGLGVLGLLAVQLARLNGAAWVGAVDPLASRRALAQTLGADGAFDPSAADVGLELKRATGSGVDTAIELSGSYAALHEALRGVRVAGTVVAAGFYAGGAADLQLGQEFHHNRLTLLASMGGWDCPPRDPAWPRARARKHAADLLSSGRLQVDDLVTDRIPFGKAADAYRLIDAHPDRTLRVVLVYEQGSEPAEAPVD
jgi:2-desacetyl-2-hydroxyethyl bacteriochlorophyllide A dehydrogenase